jgi:hypothetical protein
MAKNATAEHFLVWESKYHRFSDAELMHARKDCGEAAQAMPDDAGYYMDEISVIIREQNRRENKARATSAGRIRRKAHEGGYR